MKKFLLYLAFIPLPIAVLAQDYLPRDVQRFVDRREGCDHMRGESDRLNELSREIPKLCGGTDKELAQLKRKYAANSTIMQILNQFETVIEAGEVAPSKSRPGKRAGGSPIIGQKCLPEWGKSNHRSEMSTGVGEVQLWLRSI